MSRYNFFSLFFCFFFEIIEIEFEKGEMFEKGGEGCGAAVGEGIISSKDDMREVEEEEREREETGVSL